MMLPKPLPTRPSLDSLRKQAKKLSREIAAGNTDSIVRARNQLPDAELPLSQRDAQLVIAREYGFAGWRDLTGEVLKRSGHGLDWAIVEAQRAIHDDDLDRLRQLVREYPALVSSHTVLSSATHSFGDSFDPFREEHFTRRACAEFLIDAGAAVTPDLWRGLIISRANGLLQLLRTKNRLPHTLDVLAALGDLDGVRACLNDSGALRSPTAQRNEVAATNDAFVTACRFKHRELAAFLLDRCIEFDADLGRRVDTANERTAFIEYLSEQAQDLSQFGNREEPMTPWRTFVMHRALRAIQDDDSTTFVRLLTSESWLLDARRIAFQVELIERACFLRERAAFVARLLDLRPAICRYGAPPSDAIIFALEYGNSHLIPLLTTIWPLPDDLPHAAGMGDFARVKRWFSAAGEPALGDPADHYPGNHARKRLHLQWGPPTIQHILDTALAWACINCHLEIAAYLLEHGADIDTDWSTHEPASILHELVFHENHAAMTFLIDHGIDLTIRDYRWNATARGWAHHAAKNEEAARFLAHAENVRRAKRSV